MRLIDTRVEICARDLLSIDARLTHESLAESRQSNVGRNRMNSFFQRHGVYLGCRASYLKSSTTEDIAEG